MLHVVFGPEWRRAARALRIVDAEFPGNTKDVLRDESHILAAQAKAKVRAFRTHGSKHTGLRARVARGVKVDVSASSRPSVVTITSSMAQRDERYIPIGMDRQTGWRHPVFARGGRSDAWVTQHTGGSWFQSTFSNGRDNIEHGLHRMMEHQANRIG